MNDAYFAAIMKNKRGIENLKNEIIESGLREELKNIPILVIDDESDAASINVASRKNDQNAVSATNKAIRDLLKELPRAQYVAYTATPSANFFINPDIAEDIFPKDFAIALPTPPGYMGGQDFEKKKFIRDIWLEDTDRNLETLRQAVDSYVLAGAVKLFRVKEKNIHPNLIKHHTMLIHESANNQEQEDLATKYLTKEIWNKHDYYGGDGLKRLKSLYEKDFLPHSETLIEEESIANDMPSFGLLKKYILEAIRKIESGGEIYKIVNQLYPEPDFSKESIWKIFIGGQKISRGYTIEGLTISYYTRPTTAGDTLQQMARWFGYRKNYKDLVRLYICRNASKRRSRDLYHEFIGLTAQENRLRKKLLNAPDKKNAYEKDLTPISWSYIVRADSDLPPTRKSAMQDVELVTDNFARDYKESELFPTKKEIERIENNYSTLVEFFNQPQIDMKEHRIGFKGETSYSYITAKADPSTFLDNFLLKFKMQEDKPDPWRYVKDYLLGRDFDNEIDQWLLMVVKGTGSELLKHHEENDITTNLNGFKVTCVKRTRKDFSKGKESHGGFVSSVPEHRVFAEYLSYPETFSKDLYIRDSKTDFNALYSELENKKTAVALIYLANFIELEPVHSVGISLFFPDNGQPKAPVFKFKKDRPSY